MTKRTHIPQEGYDTGSFTDSCPGCGNEIVYTFRDWFFGTCGKCGKEFAIIPVRALPLIRHKHPELRSCLSDCA